MSKGALTFLQLKMINWEALTHILNDWNCDYYAAYVLCFHIITNWLALLNIIINRFCCD